MAAKANAATAEPEVDEAEEETTQPRKKLPLKLIIIAAAAFLVVAGGGTGAYFMFMGKKDKAEEAKAAGPAVKVAFLDLPDVIVNLTNPGSDRTQYLKAKIVLELPDQALIQQITPVMPRVIDAFQTYLRELRPTDLEGSAGLYRLKEELTRRVNTAIEPARINAVLFKELLVQ
ncbi:MAG: flagellar basal body-associated protein FliL [Xanthobacteraceae bacterium]|jgi:flagellar protein FliL